MSIEQLELLKQEFIEILNEQLLEEQVQYSDYSLTNYDEINAIEQFIEFIKTK